MMTQILAPWFLLTALPTFGWSLQAVTALDAKDEEIQKLREAKEYEIDALRKNKDHTIEILLKVQQSKDDGIKRSAYTCLLCRSRQSSIYTYQ
jgi:hypothetical protein